MKVNFGCSFSSHWHLRNAAGAPRTCVVRVSYACPPVSHKQTHTQGRTRHTLTRTKHDETRPFRLPQHCETVSDKEKERKKKGEGPLTSFRQLATDILKKKNETLVKCPI